MPPMKSRYSAFSIARNAFSYHKDWERAWRSPRAQGRI
jgi:sarcosine oxidase subunit beta